MPKITAQLLGVEDRSSWCGDTDATGRYVCRRIRDHKPDQHVGRSNAGGIHQWPAQPTRPVDDPSGDRVGTVRVHPDDDRLDRTARRRIAVDASDYVGPYEGCRWQRLTGAGFYDGGPDPLHSRDLVGWQRQPLAELAFVLGHPETGWPAEVSGAWSGRVDGHHENRPAGAPAASVPPERCFDGCPAGGLHGSGNTEDCTCLASASAAWVVGADLREQLAEQLRVEWEYEEVNGACYKAADQAIRLMKPVMDRCEASTNRLVQELLGALQQSWNNADGLRADLAAVRASREAWAIEADRLDAEVARLTTELEAPPAASDLRQRIITALSEQVSEFISPNEFGGYDPHYDELADIVLYEVRSLLAHHTAERDALSGMLRGMARRLAEVRDEMRFATKHVDAWRKRADRLRSQRDKAQGTLMAVGDALGLSAEALDDPTRIGSALRQAMARHSAVPADAKTRPAMVRAIADQLGRIAASADIPYRQEIQDAADALAGRQGAPGSPWDSWLAPVSGSDITAETGGGQP